MGWFDYETFEYLILPYANAIYMDIKIYDRDNHKQFCGVTNDLILENFKRLHLESQTEDFEFLPRMPLIPAITDTDENIAAIAGFYEELGVKKAALMKNNPIWFDKLEKLGIDKTLGNNERLREFYPDDKVERIKTLFEGNGVLIAES